MPTSDAKRILILVPAWPGQESCDELHRLASTGERPRTDYVELARVLGADVADMRYMTDRAGRPARIASAFGTIPGQMAEVVLRPGRYHHVIARADRLGLPLALLFKLTHSERRVTLISVWLSSGKKATFLRDLKVHSHLSAIFNYGSNQMHIAERRLGVPSEKLHLALQPVDERFWRPTHASTTRMICAVGAEARDYVTLLEAVKGLDVSAELAVGTTVWSPAPDGTNQLIGPVLRDTARGGLPQDVHLHQQLDHQELRRLYARSRFVVVPLKDVEFDAGVTTITEAMAMGKAVIVTRTRGQIDTVRHGENGLYVPPADPAALRAAIAHLLDHPREAERMGRAGRALIESHHTLDGWVRQVADVVRLPRSVAPVGPGAHVPIRGAADAR